MLAKLILVILAYLLGSIPFGYLLVKYVFTAGEDIRKVGSGNIGATNVARRAGLAAGALTYFLDAAKGAAAVELMRRAADGDYSWMGVAAIAAILGHSFSVFLGFKGGKGVATGFGAYLMLAPYPALLAALVWAAVVAVSRYVSLGSIIGSASVPIWTWLSYGLLSEPTHPQLGALMVTAAIACALILVRHTDNIKRLLSGTESRIGQGS
jgi:glycerol-3-phosphate acyltransferase PlsY